MCDGNTHPFQNFHGAIFEVWEWISNFITHFTGHVITCSDYCPTSASVIRFSWWHHQMEIFSALLALCAGNSPVTGEFPTQRPVTRSFDVFFDLWVNKRLSKQWWGWWFETPSYSLWRHCNVEYLFRSICTVILNQCWLIIINHVLHCNHGNFTGESQNINHLSAQLYPHSKL